MFTQNIFFVRKLYCYDKLIHCSVDYYSVPPQYTIKTQL